MDEQKRPSDEPTIRIDVPPGTLEICYECQMSALHLQSFSLSQFEGKSLIQDVKGGKKTNPDQPRLLTHLQELTPFNAHKRPTIGRSLVKVAPPFVIIYRSRLNQNALWHQLCSSNV